MTVLHAFFTALTYAASGYPWYAIGVSVAAFEGVIAGRLGPECLWWFCIFPCLLGSASNVAMVRVADRAWSLILLNAALLGLLLAAARACLGVTVAEGILAAAAWACGAFAAVALPESESGEQPGTAADGSARSLGSFFCVNGAALGTAFLLGADAGPVTAGIWTWFLAHGLAGALGERVRGANGSSRAAATMLFAAASVVLGALAAQRSFQEMLAALLEAAVFVVRTAWAALVWLLELLGGDGLPKPADQPLSLRLPMRFPRDSEMSGGKAPWWLFIPVSAIFLAVLVVFLQQAWKLLASRVAPRHRPGRASPRAEMAFKDFFLGLVRELLDAALAIPLAMARAVKRRVVLPVMAFLGRKAPESEPLHPDKVVAGCYRWLAAWAKRRGKQRMPFETPLEHGRRLRGLPGLDEGLAQCVLDIVNSFMVYRYGAGPVSPEIAISAKRAREKLSSVRSTRWHAFRERKRG